MSEAMGWVEIDGDPGLVKRLGRALNTALGDRRRRYLVNVSSLGRVGEVLVAINGRKGRLPLILGSEDLEPGYVTGVVRQLVERFAFMVCAALLFAPGLAAQPARAQGAAVSLPASVDAKLIPNYRLVEPGLATAGKPTDAGLRALAPLGVRTVIDLRAESEGTAAERQAVEAAGLRYVSVPVTPDGFRREDVEAVGRVLDDPAARPLLLHCVSANRVGAVWTVWQVMKGRAYADAEAEGRQIGLHSPAMIEAVQRVLGRH